MSSRFFHGDSSSDSSSSDEEELYPDEEEAKEASSSEDEDEGDDDDDSSSSSSDDDYGDKQGGANKFLLKADSESEDSSDEDRAKVVKSAKDKRVEEIEGTVKAIENGQKINDWVSISTGMYAWLESRTRTPYADPIDQNSTSSIVKWSSLFRRATPPKSTSRLLLNWRIS